MALKPLPRRGDSPTAGDDLAPLWGGAIAVTAFMVFVLPLLVAALLLEDTSALAWALLVVDLIAFFLFAVATARTPVLFVGVLIFWFALQRLVVAMVAPEISADMVRLLLLYKEGFYMIAVAAGLTAVAVRYLGGERTLTPVLLADLLALAFLAVVACAFLYSSADLTPKLTYLRRFAAPVFLYLGGRLFLARDDQLRESVRLALVVVTAVALFGLVERFLLDISFWQDQVEATTFYSKQAEAGLIPSSWLFVFHGVPDGVFISLPLEVPVRRLVSTFLEPTTLGSFLAFGLLVLMLTPWPFGKGGRALTAALSLLLAVALVATVSRGAMLVVLAGVAVFFALRVLAGSRRPAEWRGFVVVLPVLLLLSFGVALTTFSFSNFPEGKDRLQDVLVSSAISGFDDNHPVTEPGSAVAVQADGGAQHPPGSTAEGASSHLAGLRTGMEDMLDDPLGRGLGTSGNWAEAPGSSGESMMGTLASQLGLAGLVLWSAFLASVLAVLVQASFRARKLGRLFWAELFLALAAAFFGLHVSSYFSESASGLLGNALYFLFAGWAVAVAIPSAQGLRWNLAPLPLRAE